MALLIPALVQQKSAAAYNWVNPSVTNVITLPAASRSGNTILVHVAHFRENVPVAVTDSAGNTYTIVGSSESLGTTSNDAATVFACLSADPATSVTVTVTTGSNSLQQVIVTEFSGVASVRTCSPYVGIALSQAATNQVGDLIYCHMSGLVGGTADPITSSTSGYTQLVGWDAYPGTAQSGSNVAAAANVIRGAYTIADSANEPGSSWSGMGTHALITTSFVPKTAGALITNTFESSAADGTTITIANSANPNAVEDVVTTAATVQYSTAQSQKGTKSMRLVYSNVAGQAGVQFTQATTQVSSAVRFYLRFANSLPSTSGMGIFCFTSSLLTSRRAFLTVNNNGYPAIFDNDGSWRGYGGGSSYTGSGSFALDTWYRVEFGITTGDNSTGSSELKIYTGDSTTAIPTMSWTASGQQYGSEAGGIGNLMLGRFSSSTPAANGTPTVYYDDVAWNLGSANLLGPSSVGSGTSGDVHVHIGNW